MGVVKVQSLPKSIKTVVHPMQTSSHFPEALIAPQLHTFLKQPESSEQQSTKQGEAKRVPFAADRGTYEKQNVFGVNCTVAHWYAS